MRTGKVKLLLAGVIILCGCLLVYFLQTKFVLPILMYHSVNPVQNPYIKRLIVHPASFERQMAFLKRFRYRVVPLEYMATLIEQKKVPWRTLAITFDDGYKDTFTYAFPILKKYSLPATIFVITNEIGRSDRLSWNEIRAMQQSGLITIGSHAVGPDPLIKATSEEHLRKEIFGSKQILQERLGKRIDLFSYPEGMFNEHIRSLVKEAGYSAAVATSLGKRFSNRDIFALKRLRISSSSDNLFVFWFETSGLYTFLKEKKK